MKRPRTKTPSWDLSEDQIQRSVLTHLQFRGAKDCVYFAVPNGGWRSKTEASIMKRTGTTPGIPDLILIRSGSTFALEIKRIGGRLSLSQIVAQGRLRDAGATVATVYGLDQAIYILEEWGILPRTTLS